MALVLVAGLRLAYLAFAPVPASSPVTAAVPVAAGTAGGDVTIYGEVHRPGKYPLLPGEQVAGAILRAGGLTTAAKDKAVKVIRKVPGKGNVTLVVNLRDVLTKGMPGKDIPLLPGDIVVAEERLIKLINF